MPYTTVAEIGGSFPGAQWDPAKNEPGTAVVTGWIAEWSATLDGQIMVAVAVPVSEARSPLLYGLCAQITRLRVRADVYDHRYPPVKDEASATRQSVIWRKLADDLVAAIIAGAIADGEAAGASPADGRPAGSFGGVSGAVRDRQW